MQIRLSFLNGRLAGSNPPPTRQLAPAVGLHHLIVTRLPIGRRQCGLGPGHICAHREWESGGCLNGRREGSPGGNGRRSRVDPGRGCERGRELGRSATGAA